MKINKNKLKEIIKEELNKLQEGEGHPLDELFEGLWDLKVFAKQFEAMVSANRPMHKGFVRDLQRILDKLNKAQEELEQLQRQEESRRTR